MHYGKEMFLVCLMSILGAGCDNEPLQDTSAATTPPVDLISNAPPTDVSCAGWQQDLARGKHTYDVETCLRDKALRDRPAAVTDAQTMHDWTIQDNAYSQLAPLITALTRFPEEGGLENYLRELALLPNEPGEYSSLDRALTASEYLGELGNVYWFDAETGVFPNEHDYLLKQVALLSDLREVSFTEVAPQDYSSNDEPYLLKAQLGETSWQQRAENYGDWYDLSAVLALLNRIALDQESRYRFVTLPTGDQTAIIWAVEDDLLTQLTDEKLVRISPEEASMQTGKAFEKKALKGLQERTHESGSIQSK